jgi:hypothetical protein
MGISLHRGPFQAKGKLEYGGGAHIPRTFWKLVILLCSGKWLICNIMIMYHLKTETWSSHEVVCLLNLPWAMYSVKYPRNCDITIRNNQNT